MKLIEAIPDPAHLSNADLHEVAGRLQALAARVAGRPGEVVTRAHVADLDGVAAYLFGHLHVQHQIVLAEYLRRAEAIGDADELVGEVESFLATEAE